MTFPYANQGDVVSLERPDRDALVGVRDGEVQRLTFGEFDALVDTLAHELSERHAPGSAVGLLGENSPAWLVVFYAAQRAGMVPVPISYRLPPHGIAYIAQDADIAALYVDASRAAGAGSLPPGTAVQLLDAALLDRLRARPVPFDSVQPPPEQVAMMLYTSGSTGNPKGVELSQRSHLWVLEEGLRDADPDARLIVAAPLYHMNGLGMTQRSIGAGQTVVLLPRFGAVPYLSAIAEHRVSDLSGVPPMFAMLAAERTLASSLDLSSVRTVYMSSAPAAKELFAELDEMFDHPRYVYRYGTTESGPIAFADPEDGSPVPYGSVGVAHPSVELRLVGADGSPAPEDVGTLQIRCPGLMNGYHQRPDLPSPITPDGFYHTKDVFRVDEHGFYFFIGREDDMFTSGGENIYPRNVEIALESHPAVSQVAVVPVPDRIKGAKPVAFVVLMPGAEATEDELKRHSLELLEPAAHPRSIWFLDELPLSTTNKIDKAALAQQAAELAEARP